MKAILSVVGKDSVGILAKVATKCAEYEANIEDVTQSVLDDYFVMVMVVSINEIKIEFNAFIDLMTEYGLSNALSIHVMHEDIFNSMHKI